MSNKRPVMYLQNDDRWGWIRYSSRGDSSQTIGSSGCGTTSMAMVLATLVDRNITPKETSADALANGYRTANEGTDWSYFAHVAKKYNLRFKQTESVNEMLEAVKNGAYAVLSMQPPTFTRYGHFICAYDYDGNVVSVNDPASMARTNQTWNPSVFRNECGQCFIFYPNNAISTSQKKSRYCESWQIFYNKITGTKAKISEDGFYGTSTQKSLDFLLTYINKGKKYKYCYEFQRWFNKITDTSKPIKEDGYWGTNTEKAFITMNNLVKA
ncbi:C39 family peptidase [Clostridium tagluense]|uniref:Peptidase C39-like domain-containing protein n=1 Tax=Clostridium tagluense TaxID=360422 RepID=A0A401UM47_9CLOT|nr:C39 family peptidase [Clostridium tagluense]GCD10609.1 hypothetical protein Ctaglu_22320 [Clostridium tagluense]